jgi:hypothetical protein
VATDPQLALLQEALLEADLQSVTSGLLDLVRQRAPRYRSEVMVQSARLRDLEAGERKGVLSMDESRRERARLSTALAELITQLEHTLVPPVERLPASVPPSPSVFLSYSWANRDVADEVDAALATHGIRMARDVRDAPYGSDIPEFMQRLGAASQVVILVSDSYLKSRNCMYEALVFLAHGDFRNRAFPVVLPDAVAIYDAGGTARYIEFWEEKVKHLNAQLKNMASLQNANRIYEELNHRAEIRRAINTFIDQVQRINTLSLEIHRASAYRQLAEAIRRPA